jgi:hypothetical protein
MKEILYWSHLQYLLRKGSPYMRHFNTLVKRIREAGLPFYLEGEVIRKRMSGRLQLQLAKSRSLHDDTGPQKLNSDQLQGAFYMLMLGHSTGFVALLCELLLAKIKRKTISTHNGASVCFNLNFWNQHCWSVTHGGGIAKFLLVIILKVMLSITNE